MSLYMLKRDMQLALRCLLTALLFVLTLGAIGFGTVVAISNGGSDSFQMPQVAVVDSEDSLISRMIIRFVEESDFIAPLFSIRRIEVEQDALQQLTKGNCAAVIVLPKNFIEDISRGKDSKGEIYLSEAMGSYSYVVASAARFGEKMLAAGQYGVFSGEWLIQKYACTDKEHTQFLQLANADLLYEALRSNEQYYESVTTDYDGTELSVENYFITAWLAFILSLFGLCFWKLYKTDRTPPILERLAACGVKKVQFLLGKIIFPAMTQIAILLLTLCLLSSRLNIHWSVKGVCALLLAILMASGMAVAFAFCIKNELLMSATISFLSFLLCGGVIPRPLLPEWLSHIGNFTPLGTIRSLLAPMFGAKLTWNCLLLAIIYLFVSVYLAVWSLKGQRVGRTEGP